MNLDMTMFHQAFFEEATDLLEGLEGQLLRLEETPEDPDLLNTIFRCAHSIKGGSATFGFTDIAHFTHGLETLLDRLRNGQLRVSQSLVQLLFESLDQMKALLAVAQGEQSHAPDATALIARIEAAIAETQTAVSAAPASEKSEREAEPTPEVVPTVAIQTSSQKRYHLRFVPGADTMRQGADPILLLSRLSASGEVVSVQCDFSHLPSLITIEPETCFLGWDIEFLSERDAEQLLDIFEFVADESELTLTEKGVAETNNVTGDTDANANSLPDSKPINNDLAKTPELPASDSSTEGDGTWGVFSPSEPAASESVLPTAQHPTPDTRRPTPTAPAAKPSLEAHTLRVATDKVDKLINLVGELVINQSMLHEVIQDFSMDKLPRLIETVAEVERASRELQERVMAIRMLPIKHAFGRFPRLVRDLAATCGKQIELKTQGEETELDKTVIEVIADPLTHLVRNSIDHGLETPEDRRTAGKPETGTITLNAFHEGGNIVIEVSDDGRGLNRDRIYRKAVERGLIAESDPAPSDEVLYNYIFHPGFSTAAKVTDLSGRGVGMDIVKQAILALGGSISLSSVPEKGTRFRIRLPLTMAILEGLSLSVGKEVYILPLTSIIESIRPKAGEVRRIAGQVEVAQVRGEILPILRLHQIFGTETTVTDPSSGLLVIVENDGRKVALLVDELIGQSQVVIKSLESNYRKVDYIAGATILGDGRVALIIDVPGLVRGHHTGSTFYANAA